MTTRLVAIARTAISLAILATLALAAQAGHRWA